MSAWREAFNAEDWARFAALHAPEYRYADHSVLHWPDLAADEALANWRNVRELTEDFAFEFGLVAGDPDA